jgi:hypothetical protein
MRPQTEEEREITKRVRESREIAKRVRERFHKRMEEVGARFMNDNERLEAIRRLLSAEEREERAALGGGLNALESNLRGREEDLREEIEAHIQDPETQRFIDQVLEVVIDMRMAEQENRQLRAAIREIDASKIAFEDDAPIVGYLVNKSALDYAIALAGKEEVK